MIADSTMVSLRDQASSGVAVRNMEDRYQEVKKRRSSNKLKLHDEKIEAIWCGSKNVAWKGLY